MADIDDRHAHLVAQPLDVGEDFLLARLVERGKRLVHDEEPRPRQQRAADRDPLFLATRQAAGPPRQQRRDAEQLDDVLDLAGPPGRGANQRP